MRILVVDDSKTFREATKLLLKKNAAYQIIAEADNGKQAIEMYLSEKPDLILMDIEMPVLSGVEATKKIRETDSEIKIIAISAHLDKLYFKEAIDAGFSGFVYKNNMPEQLHEAIEYAIEGKIYLPSE